MFKRTDKDNNHSAVPSKRPKLDESKRTSHFGSKSKNDSSSKQNVRSEDVWGDDFAEEEIEEMDFVASQASLRDDNIFIAPKTKNSPLITKESCHFPSTSKKISYSSNMQNTVSQLEIITQDNYTNFERKLLHKQNYNSTFQLRKDITVSDNVEHTDLEKELDKLKTEKTKLLNDFIMKDGETVFLRNQLQQTQVRADNDKLEKMRLLEEQANRHRAEINQICKEKEDLKTQLDLQALEIEKLLERCKLLESGHIKLIEPHTANIMSPSTTRRSNIMNRSICATKSVRGKDINVQANIYNKSNYYLKTLPVYYPLLKIPLQIFGPASSEKSLVEIQITEKTGKRNLPILQEEKTFRIFENPDLVKPIVTMIDNRKLSLEFVLPDLAVIERKVNSELNSDTCIPIINKVVSAARELLLNATVVLQTIFEAMRNDDIRDMNDLYFSDIYRAPIFYTKSTCDANAWYENERAIEARRMIGILSCIASESYYLCNYITGKTPLLTDKDTSYKKYLQYMVRYNSWAKKGQDYEMLEMILQFVTLVGLVRRSHQFSGLISAITELLCNVETKVGYCQSGIDFVFKIFKELVFSRPLSLCYVPLTKMMMTFAKYTTFLQKLRTDPHTMAVSSWKGALHFTPDACLLQILITQIENFHYDLISTINITYALISFVQIALHTNALLLRTENSKSCNCCMKLLRFMIKMLCRSSEVSLDKLQTENDLYMLSNDLSLININCNLMKRFYKQCTHCIELKKYGIKEYMEQMHPKDRTNKNYWISIKRKQLLTMKEGIKFLRHLATCDPDFIIRLSDIEDSFHLFMNNIGNFDNVTLHENEREALNLIKSTFVFDKTLLSESQASENNANLSQLSIAINFKKKHSNFISQKMQKNNSSKENYRNIFIAYKSLFSSKSGSRNY
ncbi:hypothetical protein KPH14_010152 [Odynerus spinipes]|uniref:ATR-interacting protein mus304 n=1 Tax=Odynerus spinipes TaxID=1348599 RepID=A0AAD9RUI7_9HYME|nr:hypothetical protein KPH14_010152 [Odynerus spinipes]